ncbi:MAG: 2-oxoacid:ferredoxin oxidoreductase subunit beta [Deltaproteobacteria bacterium]|nr:2-oxoacid:ferredoxin oxidoreductase subunit beta [Deltaproteobacteria bacterium]
MIDRSYKELLKLGRFPHTWCPGCGIGAVLKNVAMAMKELGWNNQNTSVVSGIGCSGRMAGYMNLDAVHTPHGRALTAAEAIKTVRPDLNVVVLSGDGDLGAIGGNHLLHTSRRNPDITVFCNDNEIYGLTGGQAGPTTPKGTKTVTSPRGEHYQPLRLNRILTTQAPYFYARTTVYHLNHFKTCIREALLWKGFSFVDIISDCIELNGRRLGFKTAHQMFKWFEERFHIAEGVRDHLKDDELGIAKKEVEAEVKVEVEVEQIPEVQIEGLKLFALEELKQFDGTEGRPIYIGYKGKVYDISASPLFQGEKRMRCHIAGKDLTRDIEIAPHGEELLFKFPVVGRLKE